MGDYLQLVLTLPLVPDRQWSITYRAERLFASLIHVDFLFGSSSSWRATLKSLVYDADARRPICLNNEAASNELQLVRVLLISDSYIFHPVVPCQASVLDSTLGTSLWCHFWCLVHNLLSFEEFAIVLTDFPHACDWPWICFSLVVKYLFCCCCFYTLAWYSKMHILKVTIAKL